AAHNDVECVRGWLSGDLRGDEAGVAARTTTALGAATAAADDRHVDSAVRRNAHGCGAWGGLDEGEVCAGSLGCLRQAGDRGPGERSDGTRARHDGAPADAWVVDDETGVDQVVEHNVELVGRGARPLAVLRGAPDLGGQPGQGECLLSGGPDDDDLVTDF